MVPEDALVALMLDELVCHVDPSTVRVIKLPPDHIARGSLGANGLAWGVCLAILALRFAHELDGQRCVAPRTNLGNVRSLDFPQNYVVTLRMICLAEIMSESAS